jgi:hypothetical protein
MRTRLDARSKSVASVNGKRGSRHPINALLNAAFAVTAGRLATYLGAMGLSPAIAFLHADKPGRWSLAWDAIEPLRPMIEAKLFGLVESKRFRPEDFIKGTDGSPRLAPAPLPISPSILRRVRASPVERLAIRPRSCARSSPRAFACRSCPGRPTGFTQRLSIERPATFALDHELGGLPAASVEREFSPVALCGAVNRLA